MWTGGNKQVSATKARSLHIARLGKRRAREGRIPFHATDLRCEHWRALAADWYFANTAGKRRATAPEFQPEMLGFILDGIEAAVHFFRTLAHGQPERACFAQPHQIEAGLGDSYWARDWMDMNRNLFSALQLEKIVMFIILIMI